jgi:hypothetical protein
MCSRSATRQAIDATPEPTPSANAPAAAPRVYQLTNRPGTTTFRTGAEWLDAWAKFVRGCKVAQTFVKLQAARATNQAHITAVAAVDPEPAATLTTERGSSMALTG